MTLNLIASHLRDFAEFMPEGKRADFNATIDDLLAVAEVAHVDPEYARLNPLGGPAKVFDAMAARIRAGEPYDAVLADYGLQHVAVSETRHADSVRLDFLADITNLSALRDFGRMLDVAEVRKIDKTAEALSSGYEVHRRTQDTPAAFRAALDDAMKESGK